MRRELQGRYVTISTVGEEARAFVPAPLPPRPPIEWSPDLRDAFDQALLALGRLDSVTTLLPDAALFLDMYVRKEAVLSSMIEGNQSSLSDLLIFELEEQPGVPPDDVREVSNYVAALEVGLERLRGGLPLSLRLFREIHGVLLADGPGSGQAPGEFRRSQNWIGGTRPGNAAFVPPPANEVLDCLSDLERFLRGKPEPTPTLLKAALAHLQFETIHPFLDGNGRLGRLLITLLLCDQQVLEEPMLYLSLYFKTHRQDYYELLDRVRSTGDWEAWLHFFAEGVTVTATQALETAQQLHALSEQHRELIHGLGRAAASALQVHRALMQRPIVSVGALAEQTGLAFVTANRAMGHLQELGIVAELTGRRRNRLFSYTSYLEAFAQGTELPSR